MPELGELLVQCANCGRQFDDNLEECPHCHGGASPVSRCKNCGQDFDGNLEECPHCHGHDAADWPGRMREKFAEEASPREPPATHLVWAILVTLFCCLPFGLIAVVYAAMAQSNIESRDYGAAGRNADRAVGWIMASVFLGIAVMGVALFLKSEWHLIGR